MSSGGKLSGASGKGGAASGDPRTQERDQGISRLTITDTSRANRSIDPDDDGTRGETSIGKLIKQLRQGLFGVLFVMAKDTPNTNASLQLLLMFIDFFQVRVPCVCIAVPATDAALRL